MSDLEQLAAALADTPLFGGLSNDVRLQIAREMRPISFASGQTIFTRGEDGKELFFIVSDRVRLSILTAEGRELAFAHASDGAIFGEIATIDGKARTADATAVKKTNAMSLGQGAIERLLHASPEFAKALLQFLCARLREADMQLEGVALHRIEVRLARYLLGLCDRQTGGDRDVEAATVSLGISQGELALLLGASRPKVNAALMLLEDQGIVTRDGDKVHCVLDDLCELAETE